MLAWLRGLVPLAFALAGMGEAIAVPAEAIAPRAVELGNAPAAGDAVDYACADEIRTRTAEGVRQADDSHRLLNAFPCN